MLEFEDNWRYDSPCAMEREVVWEYRRLIDTMCSLGTRREILEHFKSHFAPASGASHYPSSNEDWASTDLDNLMIAAAQNTPLFIEAFHNACEQLHRSHPGMEMPGVNRMNRILNESGVGFQIDPPRLIATKEHVPVAVPDEAPSLDAQAQAAIQEVLTASERALSEGKGRQAVQEALWLLETISTAFRSSEILDGNIKARYFNKIIAELRRCEHGPQEEILKWMMQMHGYLSSPTGGRVRHGADLDGSLEIGLNEARLFCNLTRSYTTYLIEEHERLSFRSA